MFAAPVTHAQNLTRSLADLSIEELLNVSITSVSRRATPQADSPAAVSVLTHDDLERSGAITIADALRLVPGVNVGAVNSSQFAVSARGFNSVFANKMLVLVDGRAVYNPLFAGVFWDLQQPMLEDLDRVEVIRGPGGAVWGANAMNGVINIVSRPAMETQGGLAYLGGGNVHQSMAGGRFGGMIGDDVYYRVFASYHANDEYSLANGQSAMDSWQGWHGGFRLDQQPDIETQLTLQGDATVLDVYDGTSSSYNLNTLGRLTRQLSERSNVEVQVYFDRTYRDKAQQVRGSSDTIDLAAQHSFGWHSHDILWGLGYRFIGNRITPTNPLLGVQESEFDLNLFSLFVQDEWRMLEDRITVTAGAKLEHNDYTGFEIQPSLRAVLKPTEKQTIWAAFSRAVRTPSAVEGRDVLTIPLGAPFAAPGGPYVPTVVGNRDAHSEVLWAYELGYRAQLRENLSVDVAAFYNEYTDVLSVGGIRRFIPGVPLGKAEMPFANGLSAETYGGEMSLTLSPAKTWRLSASYSLLLADFHGPASANPQVQEANIPTHQVVVRSSHDLSKRASLDVQIRYVDRIQAVPAYVTADVRLLYRLTDRLDLSIVAQNLLDDQHLEQPNQTLTVTTEVPRGIYGKLTWRF